tara:strand:+ start:39881 stop:40078 length:198 start_codon:yes stop_codon:yes gene_type:complete
LFLLDLFKININQQATTEWLNHSISGGSRQAGENEDDQQIIISAHIQKQETDDQRSFDERDSVEF